MFARKIYFSPEFFFWGGGELPSLSPVSYVYGLHPGTPCTLVSSSIGICGRLGQDATSNMHQGRKPVHDAALVATHHHWVHNMKVHNVLKRRQ